MYSARGATFITSSLAWRVREGSGNYPLLNYAIDILSSLNAFWGGGIVPQPIICTKQ